MLEKRFVQIGRLVYIGAGPDKGKVAVITNILNQNMIQIDGPTTNVKRQVISIKWAVLADMTVTLPAMATSADVKKVLEQHKTMEEFNKTAWGKKILAHNRRASLTISERLEAEKLRRARSVIMSKMLSKAR